MGRKKVTENKRIKYSERESNIPPEVWDMWKEKQRYGDVKELVKITGVSQPVITYALKNGYVADSALQKKITDYFTKRKDKAANGLGTAVEGAVRGAMVQAINEAEPGTDPEGLGLKAVTVGKKILKQLTK